MERPALYKALGGCGTGGEYIQKSKGRPLAREEPVCVHGMGWKVAESCRWPSEKLGSPAPGLYLEGLKSPHSHHV